MRKGPLPLDSSDKDKEINIVSGMVLSKRKQNEVKNIQIGFTDLDLNLASNNNFETILKRGPSRHDAHDNNLPT